MSLPRALLTLALALPMTALPALAQTPAAPATKEPAKKEPAFRYQVDLQGGPLSDSTVDAKVKAEFKKKVLKDLESVDGLTKAVWHDHRIDESKPSSKKNPTASGVLIDASGPVNQKQVERALASNRGLTVVLFTEKETKKKK